MAKTRQQKEENVNKLKGAIKDSLSVVFVGFDKLSVDSARELRNDLRKDGTSYFVAKKSLLKRTLGEVKPEGETPELTGQVAVAYGNDLMLPAKGVDTFSKSHKDTTTSILGGIFEGRYMSALEMQEVASIPSMLQLRGMFVNVINSPIQGLAVALSAISEKKA